jgi:hypothetical protein
MWISEFSGLCILVFDAEDDAFRETAFREKGVCTTVRMETTSE